MRAGELDSKIVIQEKNVSRDDFGAEIITWGIFASVWAGVKYNVGKKPLVDGQPLASVPIQFRIRYIDGVKTEMRISFGGNFYDITSINQFGRREILVIDGSATVN